MPQLLKPPSIVQRVAAALAVCMLVAPSASAQLRDSFEGPQPTWTLKEADCGVRVLAHERTYRAARSGQASEYLRWASAPARSSMSPSPSAAHR